MFGNLWWLFGIIVLAVDFINPFVGFFGMIFNGIFMFIILCMMLVMRTYRKKLGTAKMLKPLYYFGVTLMLLTGLIIHPGIFSLASGFLTDIRKPAGIVFLFPESIEFFMSFVLTLISMVCHLVMCISVFAKIKKAQCGGTYGRLEAISDGRYCDGQIVAEEITNSSEVTVNGELTITLKKPEYCCLVDVAD